MIWGIAFWYRDNNALGIYIYIYIYFLKNRKKTRTIFEWRMGYFWGRFLSKNYKLNLIWPTNEWLRTFESKRQYFKQKFVRICKEKVYWNCTLSLVKILHYEYRQINPYLVSKNVTTVQCTFVHVICSDFLTVMHMHC